MPKFEFEHLFGVHVNSSKTVAPPPPIFCRYSMNVELLISVFPQRV